MTTVTFAPGNARADLSSMALCVLAMALLLVTSAAGWAQTPNPFAREALLDLEAAVGGPVRATVSEKTGLVTFLSFAPHQQTLGKLAVEAPAEDRAREFLDGYGAAFGVFEKGSLALARVDERDEVGMEHVRFRQMHQGVPVTGGEMTVHLRGSNVVAVNAKTVADLGMVATVPMVSSAQASVLAAEALALELGVTDAELSTPRLELLNRRHLGGRGFATSLAWFIEAKKIDLREFIWIDAVAGKKMLQFSQLTDALDRKVHDTAGSSTLPGPLVRIEGSGPSGDTDVDAAYEFSGDTYDYFFNDHGRDSYDGAGATIISTVDYCPSGCPYNNAFWNGTQMVYGPGFPVADDVDAHELTHAVTEFTANLFYYMQSGALNESFSDIFGETVDLTNGGNIAADRWKMGEEIGAIRDLMNPPAFGDPGKMSDGAQFKCGDDYRSDNGGVHSNSGVPNHAYALMVDGGTYNGKTVSPALGLTKAGKIQYRALANYLLSASDFLDNYNALIQSCEDLIGTAGITSADCTEVKDALDAVEMSSAWPCAPTQGAVPALCSAGSAPNLLDSQDMEGLSFPACPVGGVSTAWCLNGPSSLLGAYASSGVNSLWGYNQEAAGFAWVSFDWPGTLPANAKLQFNHSHGFENTPTGYWDGGVVEYSTNGGVDWIDGGPLITDGQTYGGTVSTCCSNPLGARSAFVADSWGYTASQLDLSTLAGGSFRYRFYIGTDSSVDEFGWWVDDARLYTCAACVATRVLDANYNGLASEYTASTSIEAGSGFEVGAMEDVTLNSLLVQLSNGFTAVGDLTIDNVTCFP